MRGVVTLPDISRFTTVSAECWHSLGARLREIGLTGDAVECVAEIGEGLPPAMRAPLRDWHLSRTPGPAARSLQLFVFGGSVSLSEAGEVLGKGLLSAFCEAGLLATDGDRQVGSPFHLSVANGQYIFSDHLEHGGGAVMGPSENTALLCRAASAGKRLGRVLDLGCGAGTVALVLARHAEAVIATDINPRALQMARLNTAINGVANVEFREGDAFAPVAGERFDLIACQPPFVPKPPHAAPAAYLFGGTRGDETALRVVSGICEHLAPRGRAVIVAAWPHSDDCPVEARIAAVLPAGCARVLHLRLPDMDTDYQAAMYAAAEAQDDEFRAAVDRWRDHFEAQGIRSVQTVCTAIQRDARVPAWNAALDVPADCCEAITGAAIDRLIAARDLRARGRAALLAARLRIPRGAVCVKEYPLDDGAKPKYVLRLPDDALAPPVEIGEDTLLLMSLISRQQTVRAAIGRFAAARGMSFDTTLDQALPAIEGLLLAGAMAP